MVVIIVFVVVLGVLMAGGTIALTYAIRAVGKNQQQQIDAEVAQFVAGMQPDAAEQAEQAQIEQNLAAADALDTQLNTPLQLPPDLAPPPPDPATIDLSSNDPMPTVRPPTPPPAPATAEEPLPPDPTL